jgi:phosphatidylglycerol lysyltransferase
VVFIAVGDPFTEAMRDRHPTLLVLGEDMVFDVQRYAPRGDGAKKVRSAVNQLARRGGRVREYRPAERRDECLERALTRVATDWLRAHSRFQMHFLSLDMFRLAELKRYFYLEVDERPVAFLCCLPIFARRGYLFEDLVREPGAPRGSSETLVLEAIRTFRREGASMATFGLSPRLGLNGSSNLSRFGRGLVQAAMTAATRLSHLDRLYHSRKKFHTGIAERCYLLKYPAGIRAREVAGVLRAFHLS